MTALDAALDGSTLWMATSWGIALHDSTPAVPRPIMSRPLTGTTTSVEVGSTRVYVGSGRSVYVFGRDDVSTVLGSGEATGAISDLLLVEPYLYAATTAGVEQFDLLNPDEPLAIRTLLTSTGFAHRLAVSGSTLYAADGDATVEAYTIQVPSFPQGIGSFGSLPRTQAVSEAGGRLYVSDGRRTEIWFGSGANLSMVGSMDAGGNSVLARGSQFVFMAGDDRRLRAFDVSAGANPVAVFIGNAAPVGGSVNRMLKVVENGSRLHVAAGDAGLLTFDVSEFGSPFLLRAHSTATGSSVAAYPGGAAASLAGGGLTRFAVGAGGVLSGQSTWDAGSASTVHDATSGSVLVSTGSRLRLFDLTTSPPTESGSVTLSASVRSAVFRDGDAIAVLADGTAWLVDFGTGGAAKVNLGSATPLFVAEGNGDVAFGEFGEDGTTTIRFFPEGNLAGSPLTATLEGAASSGITLSNRRVACFTFRGITIADFSAGGATTVIPDSNSVIATDLELSGSTLFLLANSRLQVWDIGLEGTATAVTHSEGAESAIVATDAGLVTIQYASAADPPANVGTVGGANRYYRQALAAGRTLHLWDGRAVSSAPIDSSGLPGPMRELVPEEAAISVAAVDDEIYVASPSGEVAGYGADGSRLAGYQIDESPDQRILSMRSVAGALWVSIEVNCLSGGCEFRTIVLDPRNGITKTTTIPGGALAATVEGTSAWAIFDVPAEVRELDVSDPFQPVVTASTASTGNPVAIARDSTRAATYVLGNLLYVYGSGLQLLAELLAPYEPEPSGRVSYLDQRVHVIGDGAVVTGRSFSPEVYVIGAPTAWFPAETPGSRAAAVRSSLKRGEFLYLLSDYSVEIWSEEGMEKPRRRPVR